MTLKPRTPRAGLTLLEVILATAIFLLSLVAILQLVTFGTEQAAVVRLQARTSMRCQGKLAEAMVGAVQLNSSADYADITDSDDDRKYKVQWKLKADQADVPGLYTVHVWVKGELAGGQVVESYLSRLMLDPTIRGSTMDQPAAATTQ